MLFKTKNKDRIPKKEKICFQTRACNEEFHTKTYAKKPCYVKHKNTTIFKGFDSNF